MIQHIMMHSGEKKEKGKASKLRVGGVSQEGKGRECASLRVFSCPYGLSPPPLLATAHAPLDDPSRARDVNPRTTRIEARPGQIKVRRRRDRSTHCHLHHLGLMPNRLERASMHRKTSLSRWRRRGSRGRPRSEAVRLRFCLAFVAVVSLTIDVHLCVCTCTRLRYVRAPSWGRWCCGRRCDHGSNPGSRWGYRRRIGGEKDIKESGARARASDARDRRQSALQAAQGYTSDDEDSARGRAGVCVGGGNRDVGAAVRVRTQ